MIPSFADGTKGKAHAVWCRDLSRSGLGLISRERWRIGQRFLVMIADDNGLEQQRMCAVIFCREVVRGVYHTGSRFLSAAERTSPAASTRPAACESAALAPTRTEDPSPPTAERQLPATAALRVPQSTTEEERIRNAILGE
ncbi:MAG: PilZ domain-containing protein [Planctomycetes bacterium]|nr:PilZ domain-containing protein [Planctomycetota bacterium]